MFGSRQLTLDRSARAAGPTSVIGPDGFERPVIDPGQHRRRSVLSREILCSWLQERLPAPLSRRVTVGGRELGLIALACGIAVAIAGGLALKANAGAPRPIAPSGDPVATPTPISARPAAKEVVVDVTGAVLRPGVVTLPAGSRVFEALEAAGGAKPSVDVTSLNLARVLVDGEQVLVGVTSAGGPTGSGKASSVVSLNTATEGDLDGLPGIGPVTARNIVNWRKEHGAFTKVDELQEVTGIGPKTFAKLKPLVGL